MKRPFGVYLLIILAALAAIVAAYTTLVFLGVFSISGPFGQLEFFGTNWFAALWAGLLFLIWIWVIRMLWNLDPRGWFFIVALAALNLIFAVIAIIGDSTWQSKAPAIVINGLILIYGLMPGTKDAFNVPDASQPPPAAAPAEEQAAAPAEESEE